MNTLVDDALLEIFKYFTITELQPLQRVCKRWKELISYNNRLLKFLDFKMFKYRRHKLVDEGIGNLLQCGSNSIRKIILSEHSYITYKVLMNIGIYCENVSELIILDTNYTTNMGLEYISNCRNLKSIHLNSVHRIEDGLKRIFNKCKCLQKVILGPNIKTLWTNLRSESVEIIHINNNYCYTRTGAIENIGKNFPNLVEFKIWNISGELIYEIGKLTMLKRLCLYMLWNGYFGCGDSGEDEFYEQFSLTNLTALESLDLLIGYSFTNEILHKLPNKLKQIRIISYACETIDSKTIRILLRTCPQLKEIVCDYADESWIQPLLQFKYLTSLTVRMWCVEYDIICYFIKKLRVNILNLYLSFDKKTIQLYIDSFVNSTIKKLHIIYCDKNVKCINEILKKIVAPNGLSFTAESDGIYVRSIIDYGV